MMQRVGDESEYRYMWGDAYNKQCKENNVCILSWWRHGQSGAKLRMKDAYIVNEHMDCREMVRERAKAERGALSACMVMEMQ